ncbi:alpha/beta hydrolase [Myxococcota bacterium]|nr:alpha/beta hydrolase [Myxococcota bacterium]
MTAPLFALLLACAGTKDAPAESATDSASTEETGGDSGVTDETGETAETGDTGDTSETGDTGELPPLALTVLDAVSLDEGEALALSASLSRPARLFALNLPPGARWDEPTATLSFIPDSIQGGQAWTVTLVATDGVTEVRQDVQIEVLDTITPPPPTIVSTETGAGWTRYRLVQTTDEWLDSPGNAGRGLSAILCVPSAATAADPAPVSVVLHGLGASPNPACSTTTVLLNPSDPDVSFWFGYATSLPDGAPSGEVLPYTQRRVLHLLEWALQQHPEADPERVSLSGYSMGGAGAVTLAVMHARHFNMVQSLHAQTVPLLHRPSREAQLSGLWGTMDEALPGETGASVWEEQDLTDWLQRSHEARRQFILYKHGKDDANVLFSTVLFPSPLTGVSWAEALQAEHVGHFLIWDEASHYALDPVLGPVWWTSGWDLATDPEASLRLSQSFPAFSSYALDGDPGDGSGNGLRPYDDETAYSGDEAVAGDTGWTGELAGALNRGLRWDSTALIDALDRWSIPLRALDGPGGAPPASGYPTTGDLPNGALPATVNVTPRRVNAFQTQPGEVVDWSFGEQRGTATADAMGELTIEGLLITTEWQTLELTRRW